MPLILPGNVGSATAATGYDVANSCRFNRASSDSLNKTLGTPTNVDIATFSTWIKFSDVTSSNDTAIFAATADGNNTTHLEKLGSQVFRLNMREGSTYIGVLTTNRKFRDPSAWFHIVVAFDTTQGTEANRIKLYINGVQETSFSTATYPTQNVDLRFNTSGQDFLIGNRGDTGNHPDAYFAETVFIDGQQLAADQFGEFDEDSGIWKPIDVSGLTFGNNGFYLDYEASGNLGNDVNGGTDFTENNLTAIDQSTDTCTNNFCTLNPLTKRAGGTIAEGNLQYTASTGDSSIFGTMAIPPGMKVYFEVKLVSNTAQNSIGIHSLYDGGDGAFVKGGSETGTYSFKPRGSGSVTQYFNNGSSTDTSIDNPANNTILGVAINNNNGQIHYHIAGTYINSSDPTDNDPVALVTGFGGATEQYLHFSLDTTTTQPSNQFNFGSPPYSESGGNSDGNGYGNFAHAVPSGYYALNTKNLAEYG